MKIVFFRNHNPFAISSAAANRYRTLMEGLTIIGVTVKVYLTEGYQSKDEKNQFKKAGEIHGIEYEYIFPFQFSSYFSKRFYKYLLNPVLLPYKAKKIRRLLKKEETGTIVWPSVSLEQLIAIKRKMRGLIYFTESNEFPDIHKYQKGNFLQSWVAGISESFFEKYTFPMLDGMALMTRALIKYYSGLTQPKPRLIHLPMTVDLERFNRKIKLPLTIGLEQPYIAFVGVMNNKKEGVNILIEAFAQIAAKFPDLKLYLFGFWHYDSPGHAMQIKQLKLENRVFYKGSISRDEVPSVIMNANLLVLPRPDSKQAQGGFPTKLGEYLASGVTVCATTVGEIPDYLVDGESVFFAEPGSVESFANAINRALNNPEEARLIGANGRKVAEKHFNKDVQAKVLYNFLKSL